MYIEHFHFRNDYKSDYDKFMRNLTAYNKQGKVSNDDAADMVVMMSEQVRDVKKVRFGSKSSLGI